MIGRMFWLGAMLALGASAATVATAGEPPVKASFVKMDADREVLVYKVTIAKDAKPIKQVDLHFRFYDAGGKAIGETDFIWDNNRKGKVQPIEAGKSYDHDLSIAPDNTAKADITVVRVHQVDGKVIK